MLERLHWSGPQKRTLWAALLATIWALPVIAALVTRWFFVQYVGDVAAYISAHTVNKFNQVRKDIQAATMSVGRAIYQAASPGTDRLLYTNLIVVGHSLGSVIAYDMLNDLITEDRLGGGATEVIRRTDLLLTFGSPLDKTAFIFRTQRSAHSEVRESLAQAVQPLVTSYANRPRRWLNIWSPNDWISGTLSYYDDRTQTGARDQWVDNDVDVEASTPLLAHNQYWDNRLFADTLYDAVI